MFDGMSANDAISLVRSRRGGAVLNNKAFETWLREQAPTHLEG
jgi:hypothetical protein